jgi:protein TonB
MRVCTGGNGKNMTREEQLGFSIALSFHTVLILLFVVLAPAREIADFQTLDVMIIREGAEAVAAALPKSLGARKKEAISDVHEKQSKLLPPPQGAMEQQNEQPVQAAVSQPDKRLERSPVPGTVSAVNVAAEAQAASGQQEVRAEGAVTHSASITHQAVPITTGFGSASGTPVGATGQGRQQGAGGYSSQTTTGHGDGGGDITLGTAGAPAFVHREIPTYPLLARRMGKEGKAVLRLFISERGEVLRIEIVEDTGYGFAEAAKEAVKKSSFAAARRNGVAVAARALLTVRFALQSE